MKKAVKKIGIVFIIMILISLISASRRNISNATVEISEEKITDSGLKYYTEYIIDNADGSVMKRAIITGCTNSDIKVLEVPEYIEEDYFVTEIDEKAFEGKTSLEKVILPEIVDTISIGNDAFSGCINLKEVVFPTTVKNIVSLGTGVFKGTAIEKLKCTGGQYGFWAASFQNMFNLKSIYFEGRDIWIDDRQLENEGVEVLNNETAKYLKENVTIYGHCSEYEEDDLPDNVMLSAKGFTIARSINFVDLDALASADLDEDGSVNIKDVKLTLQYSLYKAELSEVQVKTVDVNGDGAVNIKDVKLILQYSLGKIDKF